MPTCPACGLSVGYDELGLHLGSCRFVWSEAPRRTDRVTRELAARVRQLEARLSRREGIHEVSHREDDEHERAARSDREPHRLG